MWIQTFRDNVTLNVFTVDIYLCFDDGYIFEDILNKSINVYVPMSNNCINISVLSTLAFGRKTDDDIYEVWTFKAHGIENILFLHGNKWGDRDSNGYHQYDACGSIYTGVIMGAMASQITNLTIVYSTVFSDADQRRHESSASLAFVRGIHRPVTWKMFPFDDVIMIFFFVEKMTSP